MERWVAIGAPPQDRRKISARGLSVLAHGPSRAPDPSCGDLQGKSMAGDGLGLPIIPCYLNQGAVKV